MRGQGNSHYKNGMSYAKWFKDVRLLIFQRDHVCIVCNQEETKICIPWKNRIIKRTNLVVHHIDGNPKNNCTISGASINMPPIKGVEINIMICKT